MYLSSYPTPHWKTSVWLKYVCPTTAETFALGLSKIRQVKNPPFTPQYISAFACSHCLAAAPRESLSLCLSSQNEDPLNSQRFFSPLKYLTRSNQVTTTFCFSFSQLNSWRFLSLPFKSLYIIFAAHLRPGPTFKIWPQPDCGEQSSNQLLNICLTDLVLKR